MFRVEWNDDFAAETPKRLDLCPVGSGSALHTRVTIVEVKVATWAENAEERGLVRVFSIRGEATCMTIVHWSKNDWGGC